MCWDNFPLCHSASMTSVLTREKVLDVLNTWIGQNPPSRFAICEIRPSAAGFDGALIAWGLASADHVHVHSDTPGMSGRFQSMSSLSFLFGESFEVVWIDPEPEVLDESA